MIEATYLFCLCTDPESPAHGAITLVPCLLQPHWEGRYTGLGTITFVPVKRPRKTGIFSPDHWSPAYYCFAGLIGI